MKKLTIFIFLLLALAVPVLAASGGSQDIQVGNIFDAFQHTLAKWTPAIKRASLYVFWALAGIDLVWTFGFMALKGFEFGEWLSTLIKKILMIGIFMYLYKMNYFIKTIMGGFTALNNQVLQSTAVTPESVVDVAVEIGSTLLNVGGITSMAGVAFLFSSFIVMICVLFMALDLILAWLKYYMLLPISFFCLALGGLENFRQLAFNPIMTTIKIGVEIFLVTGLIGISIDYINKIADAVKTHASTNLALQAICVAFLCCLATKMVSSLVEAVFSGGIGDRANAGAGFRAVAAAGSAALGTASYVAAKGGLAGIGVSRTLSAAKALNKAEGTHTGIGSTIKGAMKGYYGEKKESIVSGLDKRSTLNSTSSTLKGKTQGIKESNIGGE